MDGNPSFHLTVWSKRQPLGFCARLFTANNSLHFLSKWINFNILAHVLIEKLEGIENRCFDWLAGCFWYWICSWYWKLCKKIHSNSFTKTEASYWHPLWITVVRTAAIAEHTWSNLLLPSQTNSPFRLVLSDITDSGSPRFQEDVAPSATWKCCQQLSLRLVTGQSQALSPSYASIPLQGALRALSTQQW